MDTRVVRINDATKDIGKLQEAAEVIDNGGLVAFPTETVYGIACRVGHRYLERLNSLKNRSTDKHYTLHIGSIDKLGHYIPHVPLKGRKLIKNAWPGPLTIVFDLSQSLLEKQEALLGKDVFDCLYHNGSIGIRCPKHPVASLLLDMTHYPVVAPSANQTDHAPATDAGQVLDYFSGQIDLLLDAGTCTYQKSSTVVKLEKAGIKVLREGVYPNQALAQWSCIRLLFVCTGNTCRSAMAEGLCKTFLAKRFGCNIDALDRMGYIIQSVGTMDLNGMPASTSAQSVCASRGVDIRNHRSTELSIPLIEASDVIFVMEQWHRDRVVSLSAQAVDKCILLDPQADIPDPIGQPLVVYEQCAGRIANAVERRMKELVL